MPVSALAPFEVFSPHCHDSILTLMQQVFTHTAAICIGLVGGITQAQINQWFRDNVDLTKVRVMTYPTTVVLESGTLPGLMCIVARVDTSTRDFDAKIQMSNLMTQLFTDFPAIQAFVTFPYEARALSL